MSGVGTARLGRGPLVVGAVAMVVAALLAAWWLLAGGAPTEVVPDLAATTTDTDDGSGAESAPDPGAEEVLLPVVSYEVFLSRDPFQPVVPEATGADTPGDGTQPGDQPPVDGDPPPAVPGDPGTPGGPGPRPGPDGNGETPDPSACRGSNEVVCDGHVVTLVDVTSRDGEPVAVIQVDTTIYEVVRGATFADVFQVRTIDGQCVHALYGDDGFRLCTGDTVLK